MDKNKITLSQDISTMTGERTSNKLLCGLQTLVFRTNSITAHNIRLKEILKRRALFGNQTVVLLSNSCGETNSGASNPFFLKLL